MNSNFILGIKDFLSSVKKVDLWFYLAFFDIKMKYRRSYIGPWWETLSSALIIATLGFLWSKIFQMDIALYLPYFAIGFIIWSFIASQINESCEIFYVHQNVVSNIKIPIHSFLLRLAFKNILVLSHSLLLLIPIILYSFELKFIYLFSFLGLLLLFINITFLSGSAAFAPIA